MYVSCKQFAPRPEVYTLASLRVNYVSWVIARTYGLQHCGISSIIMQSSCAVSAGNNCSSQQANSAISRWFSATVNFAPGKTRQWQRAWGREEFRSSSTNAIRQAKRSSCKSDADESFARGTTCSQSLFRHRVYGSLWIHLSLESLRDALPSLTILLLFLSLSMRKRYETLSWRSVDDSEFGNDPTDLWIDLDGEKKQTGSNNNRQSPSGYRATISIVHKYILLRIFVLFLKLVWIVSFSKNGFCRNVQNKFC